MHIGELTAPEQRVLGCLIEKRYTTPDQYPLSLNALRLACNQSTNRDPVVHYDEGTVREAAQRLSRYGLARLASGHSSRAVKYRHLAEDALGVGREELSVLAVLLLRGPQTPGEIKQRTERMAPLATLDDVERVVETLIDHGLVRRLERRPGQKEERYEQLLGRSELLAAPAAPAASAAPAGSAAPAVTVSGAGAAVGAGPFAGVRAATSAIPAEEPVDRDGLAERVVALERAVDELRAQLAELAGGDA